MDAPLLTVAVINSSPDVTDLLRRALEPAGVVAVTALTHEIRDGRVDIEAFVRQHDPKVIVYDIAPPYDANWRLFQHMSSKPWMRGRQFVLTSINASHVEKVAGKHSHIYEIVGKPLDLDAIVRAVKEGARYRPTA